jgi:putative membrane protein
MDLSRCRIAGGFGVSNPGQADGAPSGSGSPLAGRPNAGRFEVRATASDHFAWLRTRASLERTMMSWIRTAVSLIGFGFTIVQFFERMQELPGVSPALHPATPRYLGLALIACGIMALAVSVWQYHWTLHYLWSGSFAPLAGMTKEGLQTPLYAVTFALMLIGVFAFGAVLLRFV